MGSVVYTSGDATPQLYALKCNQVYNIQDVGWSHKRLFTPGAIVGYKSHQLQIGSFVPSDGACVFRSSDGVAAHGLFYVDGQVKAGSASTSVHNPFPRNGTFIQFDKKCMQEVGLYYLYQEGKDFQTNVLNYRYFPHYSGGHLIDYKFSVSTEHTTSQNYYPCNYFVNSPLKEYLVQRCNDYLEIPIYTPNPPSVWGSDKQYHPIPVAILFIQIRQNKVTDIYCLPNNGFDYEELKKKLGIAKDFSEHMLPCFRIKDAFYPFLKPAVIKADIHSQMTKEDKLLDTLCDAMTGMTLKPWEKEKTDFFKLSSRVCRNRRIDPSLLLCCNLQQYHAIMGFYLDEAMNFVGDFIIKYSIQNALKSEIISIDSRLSFLRTLLDLFEEEEQLSKAAYAFFNGFSSEFKSCMAQLEKRIPQSAVEELLELSEIYCRLTNPKFYKLATEDVHFNLFDDEDFQEYFHLVVDLLERLSRHIRAGTFPSNWRWIFLKHFEGAMETLNTFDEEEFEDETERLYALRPLVESLRPKPNHIYS